MIRSSSCLRQKIFLLAAALVSVLSYAAPVRSQAAQCSLKAAELPASAELFGLHLGMTSEQVKARVPQIDLPPPDDLGVAKTSISPDFNPHIDKTAFLGVRTISLDFLDNRLSSLWIGYENSFKWQTVPEFIAGISQALRLPAAWETWKLRGSRMRCADFQMTVSLIAGGASFHLLDDEAEQTIAERRAAQDQEVSPVADEGDGEIIADMQSKVYYAGACRPASEVKETNRVIFKTKEAAEKAGYKAAMNCQ